MIYTQDENIYIPYISEASIIVITNQVDKTSISLPFEASLTGNYYVLSSSFFKDLTTIGQYDYELINSNDEVVYSGILQVGDYKPSVNSYKNEKQIIQYGGK